MAATSPDTTGKGLGHDLRQARERLAAADSSAGLPVSIATLLGEGFLPSAVLQAFVEGLRYSPVWLRFKQPNTQRAFVADSVDKSRTAFTCVARLCFLAVVSPRVFVQLFLFDAASDHKERALAGITVVAFLVTLAAVTLEVLSITVQLSSWARERMWGAADQAAVAHDSPPYGGKSHAQPAIGEGLLSAAAHMACSRPVTALQPAVPSVWTARTTRLYYITSEVTGLAVTLVPLVTMAVEYAISHDGGCAAGTLRIEANSSQAQRVFYCRFIVRPFIATAISFSMITRSPQFPLVLLSSAASIFIMILRSFSVLSDPDVPSVLRVFQFLMVLLMVFAHVVFRWVVDRAVLDEYVNRRTVEAHAEQLRYENAALEAFAAEKYPPLRLRVHGKSQRASLAGTSAAHFQHHGVVRVHDTSTADTLPTAAQFSNENSSSTGSLSDLLAARDYSPTAVVVAVRLHEFARFGHRHGVRTATSIAGASVLAQVHEVVCGVEGAQPDVTERHWDTYLAVFGLLATDGNATDAAIDTMGDTAGAASQRHALHGAWCIAALAAFDERMRLLTTNGEADFPPLAIALHVGAVLGEYPGTSASAQRYCQRGPGIDGALAMLASCRSPEETILLSGEAVSALGSAANTGPLESIYEVQVHGDRFNAAPADVIQVHTSVNIELSAAQRVVKGPADISTKQPDSDSTTTHGHRPENPKSASTVESRSGAHGEKMQFFEEDPSRNGMALDMAVNPVIVKPPPETTRAQSAHNPSKAICTSSDLPSIPRRLAATLRASLHSHTCTSCTMPAGQVSCAALRTLDDCLTAACRLQEEISELHNQRLDMELTIPHSWIAYLHSSPSSGLLPLRFSDPSVEHRYRDHFQQCGVLRLPNRVLDGFFLFLGLYTLIDFFVGVPFWDRHAATSFGQADELRLFSPKHVAALVLLLLWEALTLAGAVVRYRRRPVAWANIEASVPGGVLVQFLHDTWNSLLLSHTVRYTLFAIILLLFQPSTFSMNPSYATIIGIGAFYLEPIPQHHDLLRLFFRFGVPNGIIFGMCFLLPLYLVEVFLGAYVIFWPIAAFLGRLSQDRMDRAAFVVTERATAYREALGKQQHLREQVLDTAATPAMRKLLSTVHDAAMATASEKGDADVKDRKTPPTSDEEAIFAATRGPQMHGFRPDGSQIWARKAGHPQSAAAGGHPANYLQLDHVAVIGVRFDPLAVRNTHPIVVSGEVTTALACAQRAECFAAFLAVLDAIVEKHPLLSVIEARGELVMLGGPWGAAKAPAGGGEGAQHSQQHYAAAALAFLADLRAATAAMPHYGTAFTVTTAATAEDALVLMRSALYPSADLLGPGPERVMTLLRAAVPGASATTAALHRIARNPTSFASEEADNNGSSSWAIRDAGALVRVCKP